MRHWAQDEIDTINAATEYALAEAEKTGIPPKHCCGAQGFGQQPWDRCPRCEWNRKERARDAA